jgi:1,4-dihydroxy-2-naphthoate polyprenyltransferase
VRKGASWVEAARPRTLPAAVVPVLVGSATAYARGVFDWRAFFLALVGALAIQVAANFANDVSDASRDADPHDRVGPRRMVASGVISPRRMWIATWAAVAVAATCGVGLAFLAGPLVLAIGLISVLAMLGYVGGPFPYGYHGLGEVFVFVFFGLVATAGSRFVHDGRVDTATWLLAVPVGLLAAAILVVNNLRDLDTDARVGKKTLAVLIGPRTTEWLFFLLLGASYLVVTLGASFGVTPRWSLLAWLTAPIGLRLATRIVGTRDRSRLGPALGQTALLHLLFGSLVALGTILGTQLS